MQRLNNLSSPRTSIKLMWVPAHIGVKGNEVAGKYAKQAPGQPALCTDVKYSEAQVKGIISLNPRAPLRSYLGLLFSPLCSTHLSNETLTYRVR